LALVCLRLKSLKFSWQQFKSLDLMVGSSGQYQLLLRLFFTLFYASEPAMLTLFFCQSVSLLNSLGIAMIYRLDLAKAMADTDRTVGERQVVWTLIAMLIAAAVLWLGEVTLVI
jgi:hypothetical protein